jgi:hypothetical protein
LEEKPPTIPEAKPGKLELGKIEVDPDSLKTATEVAAELGTLAAKKEGLAQTPPEVTVENKLEDKRTIDVKNNLCVDGENLSIASGRHRVEIQERAGFKSTPWQQRTILEHGVAPVTAR